MDISWDDVRLFLAVAEHGSLTEAARQLQMAQPTVSRRLAELEERIGYALFLRSVAGATLTSDGERWLGPARHMAEGAGELAHAASSSDGEPHGVVRLTAPPGVAYDFVAPLAARLRERHPGITLEVSSRVDYADLVRREADLALRTRAPAQRDVLTVVTLEHDNDAFVAPSLRKKLPAQPRLEQIDFIAWAPPYDGLDPNRALAAAIPGFRPVFAADDFIVQLAAATAGVGAIFLGKLRHRFSPPSALVPLGLALGEHARSALHLCATKSALSVTRIRAVAELIRDELRWAAKHSPGATCRDGSGAGLLRE